MLKRIGGPQLTSSKEDCRITGCKGPRLCGHQRASLAPYVADGGQTIKSFATHQGTHSSNGWRTLSCILLVSLADIQRVVSLIMVKPYTDPTFPATHVGWVLIPGTSPYNHEPPRAGMLRIIEFYSSLGTFDIRTRLKYCVATGQGAGVRTINKLWLRGLWTNAEHNQDGRVGACDKFSPNLNCNELDQVYNHPDASAWFTSRPENYFTTRHLGTRAVLLQAFP